MKSNSLAFVETGAAENNNALETWKVEIQTETSALETETFGRSYLLKAVILVLVVKLLVPSWSVQDAHYAVEPDDQIGQDVQHGQIPVSILARTGGKTKTPIF